MKRNTKNNLKTLVEDILFFSMCGILLWVVVEILKTIF